MKFETTTTFEREWRRLSRDHRRMARAALADFIDACNAVTGTAIPEFPASLRVRPLRGTNRPVIWEMTWNFARPDGRATFEFIEIDGARAVRWRRIGGHDVYEEP
ncbi:MAG: hypothetical protein KDC46_12695 [Thermoleophilia bacterium]|nr:hypothetical protein [Thermoleophilia bacterium]